MGVSAPLLPKPLTERGVDWIAVESDPSRVTGVGDLREPDHHR